MGEPSLINNQLETPASSCSVARSRVKQKPTLYPGGMQMRHARFDLCSLRRCPFHRQATYIHQLAFVAADGSFEREREKKKTKEKKMACWLIGVLGGVSILHTSPRDLDRLTGFLREASARVANFISLVDSYWILNRTDLNFCLSSCWCLLNWLNFCLSSCPCLCWPKYLWSIVATRSNFSLRFYGFSCRSWRTRIDRQRREFCIILLILTSIFHLVPLVTDYRTQYLLTTNHVCVWCR